MLGGSGNDLAQDVQNNCDLYDIVDKSLVYQVTDKAPLTHYIMGLEMGTCRMKYIKLIFYMEYFYSNNIFPKTIKHLFYIPMRLLHTKSENTAAICLSS